MSEAAAVPEPKKPWTYYLQEKIVVIFFLGFSGGLPFPLVYSTLTYWLNEAGIEKATITTFAWVGFAYAFKFLWSPLVDRLHLPVLTRVMGRRRSWLLLSQVLIGVSLLTLSAIDPAAAIGAFAFVAVAVAVSSATQDMAIDAYRIECAEEDMQPVLAAAYQYGYRIAIIVGGAGALYIADFMSWEIAYQAMAACIAIGVVTTLFAREPAVPAGVDDDGRIFEDGFVPWFLKSVIGPFTDFFRRYGKYAAMMLAFIALYRISDYVLGILANPSYDDIGFTKSEVASVAKLYGLWIALFGIAAGGISAVKFGPAKSLILSATLIAGTNLFFVYLAYTGPDIWALIVTISFDNFAQGFSGTVFIYYLSSLTNVSFTATQYALFSSLSVFVGKLVAGYSGDVQQAFGYTDFFIYAAAMGIPSVVLAFIVVRVNADGLKQGETRANAGLVYATVVTALLIGAGAVWHQKSKLEVRASEPIRQLMGSLRDNGLESTLGQFGADPGFAKEHWKKSALETSEALEISGIDFSHRTTRHQSTAIPNSVFLVRIEAGEESVVLNVFADEDSIVDWALRSPIESSAENTELGCARTYSIVNELESPMQEMLPPWIAFPDVPRMSPAWYDADRHEFILRFGQSWSLLEPEERDEITSAYPAPESWNGWYEALSDSWSVDEHCQPEE